jgi:hypothetical protein
LARDISFLAAEEFPLVAETLAKSRRSYWVVTWSCRIMGML